VCVCVCVCVCRAARQAEYVERVVQRKTEGAMGRQAGEVRRALLEVLRDPEGRLLRLFSSQVRPQSLSCGLGRSPPLNGEPLQEFAVLVGGIPQEPDVDEWARCSVYKGYYSGSQQVRASCTHAYGASSRPGLATPSAWA
jgi:hypothetical protein